jgi:hypothetical protein
VAPSFDRRSVRYALVHRERYVEPLHYLASDAVMPGIETPVEDLYLASTAQIYPSLTNGESIAHHAQGVAEMILARRPAQTAPELATHAVAAS